MNDQPLSYKVELFIECRNLKNMDMFSKSDPIVLLFSKSDAYSNQSWREIGRTEMINDNLNPRFTKTFILDYHFEITQPLRFVVYDVDNPSTRSMDGNDLIGMVEVNLGEICVAQGQKLERELVTERGKNKRGTIIIRAEEVANCQDNVTLQFKGVKLAKKDFFGLSDPFLIISRAAEDGTFVDVFKSETIKFTLNPNWKPFSITSRKICNGDYDRPLRLSVWDWNRSGNHSFIGQCSTTLRDLTSQTTNEFQLIDSKLKKNKQNTGKLIKTYSRLERNYTFLEYILGGCEMSLIVSIDFTASNGDPRDPRSLHYLNVNQMNQYQRAIGAVGDILANYDHDKKFPVFGFGGRINGVTNHCFPLNRNPHNPEVNGVQGIQQAYVQAMNYVQLYGPTLFAPSIRMAAQYASQYVSQERQKYFILLILTDGVITDMDATIKEIINASSLPLSIVIVGVGNADFKAMDILDSDDHLLRQGNNVAKRDIVQFVPFNEFINKPYHELAKATLAEIPGQVEQFMKQAKIVPNVQQRDFSRNNWAPQQFVVNQPQVNQPQFNQPPMNNPTFQNLNPYQQQ